MSTTSSFSAELRREAQPIWEAIFNHPFLQEIRQGTLPLETFRFYLAQDYQYLEGFARVVSIALWKAPDPETMKSLFRRLQTPVERPIHARLFELLEMDESSAAKAELAPTTRAYIDHMLTSALEGGVGEAAAALLPCPWTYHELGSRLGAIEHSTYREWADFYSQGFLEESVAAWREVVDRFGSQAGDTSREAMRRAFLTSSRYEYLFWDMAYRRERWPV